MTPLEQYAKHWEDLAYRRSILLGLHDGIWDADWLPGHSGYEIFIASHIEFMALCLGRMYEHISEAVGLFCPWEEGCDVELRPVRWLLDEHMQGGTGQGATSWRIPADRVRVEQALTFRGLQRRREHLEDILPVAVKDVPECCEEPEYWDEPDILAEMCDKIRPLYWGHILYEGDVPRIIGHSNSKSGGFKAYEVGEIQWEWA